VGVVEPLAVADTFPITAVDLRNNVKPEQLILAVPLLASPKL
jgi:hypothetical protein